MAPSQRQGDLVIAVQFGINDIASRSHSQMLCCSMRYVLAVIALLVPVSAIPALADDPSFPITMKNNQFVPSEVQIPAGVKVKLVVHNDTQTVSEFESSQFHREKIVAPGQEITVFVGPLDPGSYEFFDDFHPQTRGHLIVR